MQGLKNKKDMNEYFMKDFMEDQNFSKSTNVTNDGTYNLEQ